MRTSYGDDFKEILRLKYSGAAHGRYSDWISENTFLKGKKYSFKDHEYQLGPVDDPSRVLVMHKCAQLGFTECFFRWELAFLARNQGSQAIFTQPTANDMQNFSKSRADLIVEECPIIRKLGAGTDNAQLKRIGTSYMNLRGTFGSRAAISVPSDANVYDEVNFSNPRVLNQYKSRLQHSEFKFERYVSTPTIPGYGVTELYNRSDQKRLNLKCCHCNHHQFMTWPDSIFFERADGIYVPYDPDMVEKYVERPWDYVPRFACKKCGREVDRSWDWREWISTYPERAADPETGVSGWFVSQLDAVFIKAVDVVKASDRRLEGYRKIEDFYNFVLALAYEGGDSVKITDACKPLALLRLDEISRSHGCYLGQDLGSVCHIVILKDLYINGELTPTVIAALRINKEELETKTPELMKQYGIAYGVSDAQPYTITVEKIAKLFPERFSCCYFGGRKAYSLSEDGVTVTANKTLCVDEVTEELPRGNVKLADGLHDLDVIWSHLKKLVKVKAEDDDGTEYYEYVKVGDDHFGLALAYALLARRIYIDKETSGSSHAAMPGFTGVKCSL